MTKRDRAEVTTPATGELHAVLHVDVAAEHRDVLEGAGDAQGGDARR